jgi:hypothetical protein
MSTILTRVQESVSRVDRTRALVMGILTGLAAFFALWKIFWLIFAAATLSASNSPASGWSCHSCGGA